MVLGCLAFLAFGKCGEVVVVSVDAREIEASMLFLHLATLGDENDRLV